ncbi:hypothetical protein TUM3794_20110 [Shewanella colwelliana]|uniref:Uncharacterized protein n=1 Tax=Shewanella colwelliana TaxID=23 RepID=A0ABQ4P0B4_SHECO|nr:hypothetical protein [Shewanella colwelliana]GIU40943.1 hypothetical protein TUM3794_20110 [Shewanella colwelliana]
MHPGQALYSQPQAQQPVYQPQAQQPVYQPNPQQSNQRGTQPTYSHRQPNQQPRTVRPQQRSTAHSGTNANNDNFERYCGAFPPFFSLKCHASQGAVELKPSQTKSNEWHTIMLEGALAIGQRQYNWASKTAIQITKTEICYVTAVFLGLLREFEAKSHGPQKNKGFRLQWQENRGKSSLFINVFEGGKKAIAVPISAHDALMFGHMCCCQYVLNFPTLSVESFIESLKLLKHLNV